MAAKPPERPLHQIWSSVLDAETNMPTREEPNSYSGRIIYLLTVDQPAEGDEYKITFSFDIEKAGEYEVWLASSQPGASWVSPCDFTLDGAELAPREPADRGEFRWGVANTLTWNLINQVTLDPGEHKFAITVKEKRKMDEYLSIVIDALALKKLD